MGDRDRSAKEEQFAARLDPALIDKWGDPTQHPETQLSKEQIDQLLQAGREVFISHLTKDGTPMVTVHFYCFLDAEIWSTTVRGRAKEKAYRRHPRCALCISSTGLRLPFSGGLTLKARAQIVEDRPIIERVCREHARRYYQSERAQEMFFRAMWTPNRLALHFTVDKIISWANVGTRRD